MPLLGIAESDCERLRDGLVAQPANTISSLAYVAVGLWVLWRVSRQDVDRRRVGIAFGLAMLAVGTGSVAFHGPGTAAGRFVHDYSIAVLLLVIIAADLISLRRSWTPAIVAALIAAAVLIAVPHSSNAVAAVLAIVAIALEVAVHRHTDGKPTRRDRIAYAVAALALAIAAIAQLLGRTDAPLCEPDAIWQAHALWHTLTAIALGALSIPLLDRPVKSLSASSS
jgi:hypothetical protein